MSITMRPLLLGLLFCLLIMAALCTVSGCRGEAEGETVASTKDASQPRIGVLLVSHGSRSARWRDMLLEVETAVQDEILALPSVIGIKTAFMEYTEPSIATQLKAFDEEGTSDVILVPLLLRVSTHSFDDIPTIIGLKEDALSVASLRSEGIDRYTPQAKITATALLDYGTLLRGNVVRRVRALSNNPRDEGVILVAYGSRAYTEEWKSMLNLLGDHISRETGITKTAHAWCGHLVSYSRQPTIDAITEVLKEKDRALVIPLLVAEDEMFQGEIIGGAVSDSGFGDRVVYLPDAVLPDEDLNQWLVDIVTRTHGDLLSATPVEKEQGS